MLFRYSIAASMIVMLLNLQALLHVEALNAVEKSFFIFSAIIFAYTRNLDKFCISILIITIFMIIFLGAISEYPQFSWVILFVSLNQILVPFLLFSGHASEKDAHFVLVLFAFLPIGCAVLGFAYQAAGIHSAVATEYSTGVPRFQGSLFAAARLSALAMCGVFAAVQLIFIRRRTYVVIALLNMVILLAAGGRATLAVAVLASAASIALRKDINFTTKFLLFCGGAAMGAGLLGLFWERLGTRLMESGDSGRSVMWDFLRGLAAQYPVAGVGFGNAFYAVPREIEIAVGARAAHNDYIRLMTEIGTVGTVFFYILLIFLILKRSFHSKNINYIAISTLICFLILSYTDNALASPVEFIIIFLGIIMGNLRKEAPKHKKVRNLRQNPTRNPIYEDRANAPAGR